MRIWYPDSVRHLTHAEIAAIISLLSRIYKSNEHWVSAPSLVVAVSPYASSFTTPCYDLLKNLFVRLKYVSLIDPQIQFGLDYRSCFTQPFPNPI